VYMKIGATLSMMIISILIFYGSTHRLSKKQKKEKWTVGVITAFALFVGVWLLFDPMLKSPSIVTEFLFGPLRPLMEPK